MDTQQEIKDLIKQAMFNVLYMIQFNERVEKIIKNNLADIKDEQFREKTAEMLRRYAKKEYRLMVGVLNMGVLPLLLAFNVRPKRSYNVANLQRNLAEKINNIGKGEYFKAFNQLGNSQAKTNEFGQSLYGYSEMQARYEQQQDMISTLKAKTKLVLCDTHVDCSDRCSRWQGRIYSLDGTYGKTEDGKEYIPLEVAINDTTYGVHNGLFGYNCRHKLHEYHKGMSVIKVNERERKREKEITRYQRLLEREIRSEKSMVRVFQDDVKGKPYAFMELSKEKLGLHKMRLKQLNEQYRKFCEENDRVEYRSRLQID